MTIYEAYQYLQIQLRNIYDEREAANISDLILEHIIKKNKTERRLNKSSTLSSAHETQLKQYATELLQHKPVQYVLREAWFAGMKLYVDENVLIPRPETEELVEWVIEEVGSWQMTDDRNSQFSILDVGTGSGCIAIALKKRLPNIEIHALDISEKALEIAKRNAATQNTFIHFFHCNILNEEDG
ncbi:MAG: HemK/PrmC family methyltransferase, partial [Parafilimonas sp.]